MPYQLYLVRNRTFETDGPWGSDESARWFDDATTAIQAAWQLADCIPDVGWAVCDELDEVILEIEPQAVSHTQNRSVAMAYQLYVVRNGRFDTDGCWLIDEQARWFDRLDEAIEATRVLADCYPDVGWVVCDADDDVLYEIEPQDSARDS